MTIVHYILKQMPSVRQPQAQFLDILFATILALRGRVTFRNLSRYSAYTERTFARQFRASFDWAEFHHLTCQQVVSEQDEWLAVQDASFIPKSGKQTFGLGQFWDGCHSQTARGLEISTLALVNVTRRYALTVAVAQTPPGTSAEAAPEASRMAFYARQVQLHRARLPKWVKYLAVDGAYAKKGYVDTVTGAGLHVVTRLRCDADCRFLYHGGHPAGQRGRPRKYDGKVQWRDLSRFTYVGTLPEEATVHCYTAVVWHQSLKRQVRVVVLVQRRAGQPERQVILASTEVNLEALTVVRYYRARFQIEFLFRDAKQYTGLGNCQARDEKALDFHFNASLATLNVARVEEVRGSAGKGLKVFSLARLKQRNFNERLVDEIISKLEIEPSLIKSHPRYEEIKGYGAIAA